MDGIRTFPGYRTQCLFSFQDVNGSPIRIYVEAITPVDALRRYNALPENFREGDAKVAVEVTSDSYVPGQKVFFNGYFIAVGVD